MKPIIQISELKTNFLASKIEHKQLYFTYDDLADELLLLMEDPQCETIVHYVDENVGLLFTPNNKEIVGLQIEGFTKEFIKKFSTIQKSWKLSDCKELEMADVGELSVEVHKKQIEVALEVIRAAKPIIGNSAQQLEYALEYA